MLSGCQVALPQKFDAMKNFLKELFEYNHHFNRQLAGDFSDFPEKTSERAVSLFNHLLNAQQIWNNRIDPRGELVGVWEVRETCELVDFDRLNYLHSLEILNKFPLDRTFRYQNSRGQEFGNTVRDTLFHIVNHATYHRGQIATEFRLNGLNPRVTDYIFYKR